MKAKSRALNTESLKKKIMAMSKYKNISLLNRTGKLSSSRREVPQLTLSNLSAVHSPPSSNRTRTVKNALDSTKHSLFNKTNNQNFSNIINQSTRSARNSGSGRKDFSFHRLMPKTPGDSSSRRENIEEPAFPMQVTTLLKKHKHLLSSYEQGEVLDYQTIYYAGQKGKKLKSTATAATNYGYDDERGDYNIVMGDHVRYQYELQEVLGKGSFGKVVKAYDHQNQEYVALKIIRNKSRFHQQAAVEIKALKYLKDRDTDERYNIIHIKDYFQFRKHICIAFELLSINLYEFLKSNKFQGFSLRLVRRFAVQLLQSLRLMRKCNIVHCDLKPENIMLK